MDLLARPPVAAATPVTVSTFAAGAIEGEDPWKLPAGWAWVLPSATRPRAAAQIANGFENTFARGQLVIDDFDEDHDLHHWSGLAEIPGAGQHPNLEHAAFKKPGVLGFLPNWFFAYNYPHNVNEVGIQIEGCNERYCRQLPVPVYPTPLYEIIACTLLFLVLWAMRDRVRPAGALFCLYLILNGLERFLVEKIRVNNKMELLGFQPTQAEVIAVGLMLTGILLWIFLWQKYRARPD